MNKTVFAALLASAVAMPGVSAMAAPQLPLTAAPSIVENVRADCVWVNNKWTYKKGDKMLVCRPDRPRGSGWSWYREGGREGWYNKKRREWHYKGW